LQSVGTYTGLSSQKTFQDGQTPFGRAQNILKFGIFYNLKYDKLNSTCAKKQCHKLICDMQL